MSETGAEGLDGLLMGDVSEEVKESDEQFQARMQAAQQKIAQIKKDEKKSKNFDDKLAKIVAQLDPAHLDFVIFLIDHEVPSLTILALLTIVNEEAGQICYVEFAEKIEIKPDFSVVQFQKPQIEEKISYWWAFIFSAEKVSKTVTLKSLKKNTNFVKSLSKNMADLLIFFLQKNEVEEFNKSKLEQILEQNEKQIFEG